MKKKELANLSVKELEGKVLNLKRELLDLRLKATGVSIKDNSQFRKLRVDIARALTFLKQRKVNLEHS